MMPKIKSFFFRKFTTIGNASFQQGNAITKAEKLSHKLLFILFMTATQNLKLYLLFAVISKSVKYPSTLPRLLTIQEPRLSV